MKILTLLAALIGGLAPTGLGAPPVAMAVGQAGDFFARLSDAALALTGQAVVYDPGYYSIAYPGGDIPAGRGVCTDVVIRAYRVLGIDLQKEIHEDMDAHFAAYPKIWGLTRTDTNIDHRRVPNLMAFFKRRGSALPITGEAADYRPGDIVCWDLGGGVTHIGLVVDRKAEGEDRALIVHNIGAGQVLADGLFAHPIIGHYRFQPEIRVLGQIHGGHI